MGEDHPSLDPSHTHGTRTDTAHGPNIRARLVAQASVPTDAADVVERSERLRRWVHQGLPQVQSLLVVALKRPQVGDHQEHPCLVMVILAVVLWLPYHGQQRAQA